VGVPRKDCARRAFRREPAIHWRLGGGPHPEERRSQRPTRFSSLFSVLSDSQGGAGESWLVTSDMLAQTRLLRSSRFRAANNDADTAVPIANTRTWIEVMKDLKMNYKYLEMPGEDHGTIISKGMLEHLRVLQGAP
jgi:hypothetical protein